MPRTFVKPKVVKKPKAVRKISSLDAPALKKKATRVDMAKVERDIDRIYERLWRKPLADQYAKELKADPRKTLFRELNKLRLKKAKIELIEQEVLSPIFTEKSKRHANARKTVSRMLLDSIVEDAKKKRRTEGRRKQLTTELDVIVERIAKLPKVQRKINELRSVGDTEKIERIAAMKKKVSQELKENRRKLDELAKSRKRWF